MFSSKTPAPRQRYQRGRLAFLRAIGLTRPGRERSGRKHHWTSSDSNRFQPLCHGIPRQIPRRCPGALGDSADKSLCPTATKHLSSLMEEEGKRERASERERGARGGERGLKLVQSSAAPRRWSKTQLVRSLKLLRLRSLHRTSNAIAKMDRLEGYSSRARTGMTAARRRILLQLFFVTTCKATACETH